MTEIEELATLLEVFARKRDWNQFHTPKNLSIALAVEAAELMEEFQWLTDDQSRNLSPEKLERVKDEVADVFNYCIRISTKLNIDLITAAHQKISKNEQKYPVEKSKGNARKYNEL